jgi:Family of unknown function (DUF6234)
MLSTIVWLVAVAWLVWRCFGIGLENWADDQTYGGANAADLARRWAAAVLLLAGVAAGGPTLIAVVAFTGRLPRTGAIYVAVAAIVGALVSPAAREAYHTLHPPVPAQPGPVVCQENSGADNRCPGD